jgi:hypothetical protein
VDPVADIAVLGTPDNQDLYEEAEAYEELVGSATPFRIGDVPENGRAWLLSLEGEWFECTVEAVNDGALWVSKNAQPIRGGMSGSPIVSDEGRAIGAVCLGGQENSRLTYPNPRLVRDLPVRFLRTKRIKLNFDAFSGFKVTGFDSEPESTPPKQ